MLIMLCIVLLLVSIYHVVVDLVMQYFLLSFLCMLSMISTFNK